MKHLDTVKVLFAGGTGITGLMITTEIVLKLVIAGVTLGYIIRKWYLMEKKK
jgi:hypothetical protein